MASVGCLDGSRLGVEPVPVLDRDGLPYEVSLRLTRDGVLFGDVGERCGFFLATARGRVRQARSADDPAWPDPDDRFPGSTVREGLGAWVVDEHLGTDVLARVERYLPRDHELFAFRRRDPDDVAGAGELRASVRTERSWVPVRGDEASRGRWRTGRRAELEAWGDGGTGIRAVLTSGELLVFLDELLAECAAVGAAYAEPPDATRLSRPAG